MPLPTSYTQLTFEDYLHGEGGRFPARLGWEIGTSYDQVVNNTLAALGAASVEAVPAAQIGALRAVGVYYLWRAIVRAIVGGYYDFEGDDGSYKRKQVMDQAEGELKRAAADAKPYLPSETESALAGYQMTTGTMVLR